MSWLTYLTITKYILTFKNFNEIFIMIVNSHVHTIYVLKEKEPK